MLLKRLPPDKWIWIIPRHREYSNACTVQYNFVIDVSACGSLTYEQLRVLTLAILWILL